jgi:hypothetical protein
MAIIEFGGIEDGFSKMLTGLAENEGIAARRHRFRPFRLPPW